MVPPLPILKKAALYGACFCVGTGLYFNYRIQSNFRQTGYYKQALTMLREHRKVVDVLGESIREGWLDLGNSVDNRADGLTARLLVPVKGSKSKGDLYLWASRTQLGTAWTVDRLELALPEVEGQRLLVYDRNKSVGPLLEVSTIQAEQKASTTESQKTPPEQMATK